MQDESTSRHVSGWGWVGKSVSGWGWVGIKGSEPKRSISLAYPLVHHSSITAAPLPPTSSFFGAQKRMSACVMVMVT